jgi:tagatose-1,6-bisphosphate aldolase non-catalytic subunit AgaZ/GatZ
MTSSPTLLSTMAETIQGVDAIDGILIEPCTPAQREAILRVIEPVVLTHPMAWQKYFGSSSFRIDHPI